MSPVRPLIKSYVAKAQTGSAHDCFSGLPYRPRLLRFVRLARELFHADAPVREHLAGVAEAGVDGS